MSMTYTGSSEPDLTPTPSDTPFAATPVWDRGRKRKGFGKAKSAAPVAAPRPVPGPTADQLAARQMRAETLRADGPRPETRPMSAAPVYATRAKPAKRGPGIAPIAVGAGVIVLAGLAAAGWYATRSDGVVELTPGSAATSTAALETAPSAPAPAPTQMAANTEVAPAAAVTTTTTVRRQAPAARRSTTAARTRPAPAASATDAGVNTSATLPSAPVPYAATLDGASPPPALAVPAPPAAGPSDPLTGPSAAPATPTQPSTVPETAVVPPAATPPVISDPTP